MSGLKSR